MAKRDRPIDWAGIEADYRQGRMSVREIARWYGITDAGVRKRAKAAGWARAAEPPHVVLQPIERAEPVESGDLADTARGIAGRMMDELDAVTSLHGELEDMICSEESDSRRRQALLKAISLGDRAMTLKNLSMTLKTLNEASEPEGKKAKRQANAEKSASGGRFAAPSAPKLVVSNNR